VNVCCSETKFIVGGLHGDAVELARCGLRPNQNDGATIQLSPSQELAHKFGIDTVTRFPLMWKVRDYIGEGQNVWEPCVDVCLTASLLQCQCVCSDYFSFIFVSLTLL